MEPKFKVGDRVVVWREWNDSPVRFDSEGQMSKLIGSEFEISHVQRGYYYVLENGWFWPEECLMLACPNWKVHAIAELICEGE